MSTRKLPVLATVRQAYAATREQAHLLAQIAQRWGVAAAVGLAVGALLVAGSPADRGSPGERASLLTGFSALILVLGAYVIVVRWHRLIIRSSTVEETRQGAVGGGVLYFARGTFLTVVGLLVAVTGSLLPITLTRNVVTGDARWYFAVVVTSLAITAALALLARLSLILPAGAVGDHSVTLKRSWSLTRGNTPRMLAGSALSSGPAIVANFIANGAARASETAIQDSTAIAVLTILSLTLAIVAGVIQAGFLSYAYLSFTGMNQPGATPEAR
jgi:hypothetical protein